MAALSYEQACDLRTGLISIAILAAAADGVITPSMLDVIRECVYTRSAGAVAHSREELGALLQESIAQNQSWDERLGMLCNYISDRDDRWVSTYIAARMALLGGKYKLDTRGSQEEIIYYAVSNALGLGPMAQEILDAVRRDYLEQPPLDDEGYEGGYSEQHQGHESQGHGEPGGEQGQGGW